MHHICEKWNYLYGHHQNTNHHLFLIRLAFHFFSFKAGEFYLVEKSCLSNLSLAYPKKLEYEGFTTEINSKKMALPRKVPKIFQ